MQRPCSSSACFSSISEAHIAHRHALPTLHPLWLDAPLAPPLRWHMLNPPQWENSVCENQMQGLGRRFPPRYWGQQQGMKPPRNSTATGGGIRGVRRANQPTNHQQGTNNEPNERYATTALQKSTHNRNTCAPCTLLYNHSWETHSWRGHSLPLAHVRPSQVLGHAGSRAEEEKSKTEPSQPCLPSESTLPKQTTADKAARVETYNTTRACCLASIA